MVKKKGTLKFHKAVEKAQTEARIAQRKAREKWNEKMTCILGKGGFSYAMIAARVFGNSRNYRNAEEVNISRVDRILMKNQIKVRDWRNGVSAEAKSYAASLEERRTPRAKFA